MIADFSDHGPALQQQSPANTARLAAIYQSLTPQQVRETAARVFSSTPVTATVLPETSF